MSLQYAENKIKEALKASGGNMARARQQIIAWSMEDAKLLQALTKPHLNGIVAYNIERVASGRAAAAKRNPTPKAANAPSKAAGKSGKGKKQPEFGMELLKAVASSSSEVFGLENNAGLGRRGKASQSHINAIKAIASKTKKT